MAPTPAPLTVRTTQLAEHLGVTPRTLERWRRDGSGPPSVKLGRTVRYRWVDVNSWLDNNLRAGRQAA